MTAYERELRRCKAVLLARAVVEASGNIGDAAKATGVHRNTITRVLRAGGYDLAALKRVVRARGGQVHRKPAVSVGADLQERRIA